MKRTTFKYINGNIINGHRILSVIKTNSYLVECGTCKSYATKTKTNILRNKRCNYCKNNTKLERDIGTLCWILGLNEGTIRSRITRGMSINESLYFKGKEIIESFRDYDLKYISKINEQNYLEDKEAETKALNKFNEKNKLLKDNKLCQRKI